MRGHLLGHFGEVAGGNGRRHPSSPSAAGAGACLVRVTDGSPIRHWLYVRVGPLATLRALDSLLRDTWLECCGHLSSFRTNDTAYESSMVDIGESILEAVTMDVGAAGVISRRGPLRYMYDYGTTTELNVEMASACGVEGARPDGVELVARNTGIPRDCTVCGGRGEAVCLCDNCSWRGRNTMMCAACAKKHSHAGGRYKYDTEAHFLSVANSPRLGMCAYREYDA